LFTQYIRKTMPSLERKTNKFHDKFQLVKGLDKSPPLSVASRYDHQYRHHARIIKLIVVIMPRVFKIVEQDQIITVVNELLLNLIKLRSIPRITIQINQRENPS